MDILVLETDEGEIQSLKALLKLGHKVFICKSGKDCLLTLARKRFDLLMVDVEITKLGGLDAVVALRQKEKGTGKHLPVVALGALPGSGRIPGMDVGFDHELRKPIQVQQILELMNKLTQGQIPVSAPPPAPKVSVKESPAEAKPPINEKAALALCDGDEEFFHEIVQVFLLDAPTHLEKLKNAVKDKDVDLTQRHAHALKGASSNVCAENFKFLAMQIERAAKNNDLNQTDQLCADLFNEFNELKKFVARMISGLPSDK